MSDLEKAFFLMLNQFPGDHKDYIVCPNEMILIPDIYDLRVPGIEYEIDFAIYGGSIKDPVKIAIECDGIRSHGQSKKRKDRRKDVNLQAAGWIVMRFSSREIHDELQKYLENENYISDFLLSIENVIDEKLQLVIGNNYVRYRSELTGYKWDLVSCTNCKESRYGIMNKRKHTCPSCGEKFLREINPNENVKYEYNGMLFF